MREYIALRRPAQASKEIEAMELRTRSFKSHAVAFVKYQLLYSKA